jgi:hypothetical protein
MFVLEIFSGVFNRYILFSCLILTGCLPVVTANADQPDWINSEAASYPNSKYVVANGSASSAELSKDRALANLTKVFELRIRESSTTRQEVQSLKQGGSETVQTSQSLSQNINIHTDKIIDGARIAEQWQHPADLTYYALAVLDRRQAGNNIRGEIDRLDEETAYELKNVEAKHSPLQKVAAYQRVLSLHDERSALQKTLKVIDLSGRGSESKWNRAELRSRLEASLNALKMRPQVLQDAIGGLDKLLKGAMAQAGFPEAAAGSGSYTLSSGLEIQSPIYNEGWYWLRGTLTLRLASAEGAVQGNKTWPLKVSASRQQQLNERMKDAVEKKLNQEIKSTVLGFATTQ